MTKALRRWGQSATGTWHLAYAISPTYWTAECRALTTVKADPIEIPRRTLRVHPQDPICQRCAKIARAYAQGTKT
ncbi:MAG: hypothetical protein ACYCT0_10140 [Sulfobacillus sp.]